MNNPILVVDQVLTSVVGGPAQQPLQDYLLGMVFANAAARSARNTAAPADKPQAFLSQWTNQLGSLGWTITHAGTSALTSGAGKQTATVADRVESQAGSAVIAAAFNTVKLLASAGTSDAAAVAGMFWDAAADGDVLIGSVGQLSVGTDSPTFELATLTLQLDKLEILKKGLLGWKAEPFRANAANALFADVLATSIDLSVSHMSAVLQPEVFAAKRDELIAKLGGHVEDHYRAVPPNLVGARA